MVYNYKGVSLLSNMYKTVSNIPIHMQRTLLGIIGVDFDTPGQLLITHSTFVKYLGKKVGTQRSSASAIY